MKYFLPNQNFGYLQTNRSDRLGSLWSSKNLDFQNKLGTLKLANKLVTNTTSSDDADLGLPIAFEFFYNKWWAICGTRIFKSTTANGDIVTGFSEDTSGYTTVVGGTSQFDISNPTGTTFRYTWNGTGTNPGITTSTYPTGGSVRIYSDTFNVNNQNFIKTITGSGTNYFEVTNASGVVEVGKNIGNGYILVNGGTTGNNFSSNYSDMCVFNDSLFTATDTGLYLKTYDTDITDFGGWFKVDSFSPSIHKMVYFKKYNRLYYSSTSSFIRSINTVNTVATSGDYSLDITNSAGTIRTMVTNSASIWVGTIRFNESDTFSRNSIYGSISQWDGISNQVTNEFNLKSSGVLSMCVLDDVPYAIDTKGRILQYTGYSFKEIARLPLNDKLLKNIGYNNATNGYPIHYNGMTATDHNTIEILVNNLNGDASGSINENLPSGIWELDLETKNLTHKYSPTLKSVSSSTVTDYGQNRILSAGALKYNTYESSSTDGKSNILAGFTYYTDATTTKSGIFIDSPKDANTDNEGQKRGYFVTTWFESFEITETWKKLWAIFKKFGTATDKLIFKYRLDEEDPIEATITWTSTTTFTTTTDISAYAGYEAEIIQGTGSGACANILTVTGSGTYTVTIDTAITGVTGTAKARFQKWIKLGEVSGSFQNYKELPVIDKSSTRIQIKGILEWTGDGELHKMILNSISQLKIES